MKMTYLEKLQGKDNLRRFIVDNVGTYCPYVGAGGTVRATLTRCCKYDADCDDCISAWFDEEVDDEKP